MHKAAVAVAFVLLVAAAGCGGGEGASEGASVTAYVVAPLCPSAKRELSRQGGQAGDLRVRAVCLPSPRSSTKLDLATVGANARRATEDSTTVAYLEAPDPQASRFSQPILETAGIASISTSSGAPGMRRLLRAIRNSGSGSGSLREAVSEGLRGT